MLSQTTEKMPSRVRVTGRTFILYDPQVQLIHSCQQVDPSTFVLQNWDSHNHMMQRAEVNFVFLDCKCVSGFQRWLPQHEWLFTVCGISLFQNNIAVRTCGLMKLLYVDNWYTYEQQTPIKRIFVHWTNSITRLTCHAKLTCTSTWIAALLVGDGFGNSVSFWTWF